MVDDGIDPAGQRPGAGFQQQQPVAPRRLHDLLQVPFSEKTAAGGIRPVSLELGGKNAGIIFDDADLDATLEGIGRACFANTGQVCLGTERLYVQRGIFERLAEGLAQKARSYRFGDPFAPAPWMGALEDNLDVLNKTDEEAGDWGRAATRDLIRSRIKIKSLNFMRGRTFLNKFLIIDEAQNLTPKQMKTLITRAGPGTKVVCLGNIAQIDTPYLTEGSSGLTYVVDRFKGWEHSGHVTLQRGERSRLADHAAEVL